MYLHGTGRLGGMAEAENPGTGSFVRRWRLGRQLRALREQSGKSMSEAAGYIGVRRPTISRIETGRQAILAKNVKFLCQLYEIPAARADELVRQAEASNERGWWVSCSDAVPDWFEWYLGFEEDAEEIRAYSSELVPDVLRTESYARALTHAWSARPGLAEFQRERRLRLESRRTPLRLVLNEAVVRRPAGDIAGQLRHLLTMADRDHVDLRILPFEAGPHQGMAGPFTLMTVPGEPGPSFVYIEHADGAVYLERPADLAAYSAAFEALTKLALSPLETRDFLAELVA